MNDLEIKSHPDCVILVSGLPRSGTSMMMQMLEAGGIPILADQVREADDDNPKGYYELEAVKNTKRESAWLTGAPGKAVKVIYALLPDLPEPVAEFRYQLLFMERPLAEVIKSQEVMLKRRGTTGANVSPEKLAEIFDREITRIFDWLSKRPDFSTCRINYRSVLENPGMEAAKVSEFLGIDTDREAMADIVDKRLYRQRADRIS